MTSKTYYSNVRLVRSAFISYHVHSFIKHKAKPLNIILCEIRSIHSSHKIDVHTKPRKNLNKELSDLYKTSKKKSVPDSISRHGLYVTTAKTLAALLSILFTITVSFYSCHKRYDKIKIGICADVHLPTMHDSEYRIKTFIDSMTIAKPDFLSS